ncbi:Uncharacterised protein [Mycobacteroides abscessus subsp. abscessus]|nr:Uncharacterised protein [Mycobacteroides abscessus subsp. abscessus]
MGSSPWVNVPISASVKTMPRTVSSAKVAVRASPSGRSNTAAQVRSSSTRARSSARVGSGSVRVGNTRCASRAVAA